MGIYCRFVLIPLLAVLLAACAMPASWQKSSGGTDRRQTDLAKCRSAANVTVEDRYGRDLAAGTDDGAGVGSSGSFHAAMTRHDAIQAFDRLVADCMRTKGDSKSPDKPNK